MKVYFLGIAGAGMSALATLMASEGHEVAGSDGEVYPPVSHYLERLGAPFHRGFDAGKLPRGLDLAIVGSSAALDLAHNPELAELKARGVPLLSFPEQLGRYSRARRTCVVAGSFGKSTLTAMLAYIMRESGRDPGYFIGAVPLDLPATGHAGRDPELLLEGDEYVISLEDRRSKFLLYEAQALLLSSLVHDHLNVFPTPQSYEAPFRELVAGLPPDALVVAARGSDAIGRVTSGRQVVWYGLGEGPGFSALDVRLGEVSSFVLSTPDGARVPLQTGLLGLHNIENIVGAAALLLSWGVVGADQLTGPVRRFRGVARRLDRKTSRSSVPVYEGFGSSYEKARSALEAILAHFPARTLVVVFEPHTFSWRGEPALAWYDTVFEGAGRVLVLPPPDHGADTHRQLSQREIVARISAAGQPAEAMGSGQAVLERLDQVLHGDETVLLLSSGPLAGLAESLPPRLDQRFGADAPVQPRR